MTRFKTALTQHLIKTDKIFVKDIVDNIIMSYNTIYATIYINNIYPVTKCSHLYTLKYFHYKKICEHQLPTLTTMILVF